MQHQSKQCVSAPVGVTIQRTIDDYVLWRTTAWGREAGSPGTRESSRPNGGNMSLYSYCIGKQFLGIVHLNTIWDVLYLRCTGFLVVLRREGTLRLLVLIIVSLYQLICLVSVCLSLGTPVVWRFIGVCIRELWIVCVRRYRGVPRQRFMLPTYKCSVRLQ